MPHPSLGSERDSAYEPNRASTEVPSPSLSPASTFTITYHGVCPSCHHWINRLTIHLMRHASHAQMIQCDNCHKRLFGLGGNSTHASFASQLTEHQRQSISTQASSQTLPMLQTQLNAVNEVASLGIIQELRTPVIESEASTHTDRSPQRHHPESRLPVSSQIDEEHGNSHLPSDPGSRPRAARQTLATLLKDPLKSMRRKIAHLIFQLKTKSKLNAHDLSPPRPSSVVAINQATQTPVLPLTTVGPLGWQPSDHEYEKDRSSQDCEETRPSTADVGTSNELNQRRAARTKYLDAMRRATFCRCGWNCQCAGASSHGGPRESLNLDFVPYTPGMAAETSTGSTDGTHDSLRAGSTRPRHSSPTSRGMIGAWADQLLALAQISDGVPAPSTIASSDLHGSSRRFSRTSDCDGGQYKHENVR
ncbi:MAG: hypothetical protein M1825_004582 [Sarcosagium campestre]|nr:MAG: hypothetical protein M1825_004582 [Sarcosagium campestre]